jgi:ATP-dependent DNA ligase
MVDGRLKDSTPRRQHPICSHHVVAFPPGAFRLHSALPAIPAERPPTGPGWIHEIKHDGFRMMVRRDAAGVRLLSRALTGRLAFR